MADSSPNVAALDSWAREHVRYEMQMVVAGAIEFTRRYPRMPASDGFSEPTIDDALLEATLVHLRLIDEFLAGSPHGHAITARHWVDGWSSRCLDRGVRAMIDAQVVHLSSRRVSSQPWDVRSYAHRCCEEFDRFLKAVERTDSDRSRAFDHVRLEVARGLRGLTQ